MMNESFLSQRIYVACLAAYNNGRLHGRWIDAAQDVDTITEEIEAMLAESPIPNAEEFAIHDYEGFGDYRINEYDSIALVSAVALAIEEHGEAMAAWLSNDVPNDADQAETQIAQFEDAYEGEWENLEAYADNYLEDTQQRLDKLLEEFGEDISRYIQIDVKAYARDLELSGSMWTADAPTGVYVFRSI